MYDCHGSAPTLWAGTEASAGPADVDVDKLSATGRSFNVVMFALSDSLGDKICSTPCS